MVQVLIDANLLVLLVVGLKDPALVGSHKRTSTFMAEDFQLLKTTLNAYEAVIVTPNIVTECSNLLRYAPAPLAQELMLILGRLVSSVDEHYVTSSGAALIPEFQRLGLTDAAAIDVIGPTAHLLTVDHDLYLAASYKSPGHAFNFNHLRPLYGA